MPEPYPDPADEEFDYVNDWHEAVDATAPGGGGAFSAGSQEVTLTGYVDGPKLRGALRYFLGWSSADEGSPYHLHREPPARHPKWPQLYCHSASYVGVSPKATADEPLYQTSPFTGYYGEELYFTEYEQYLLTLRYKSFGRVRFMPDDQIEGFGDPRYKQEWLRYTQVTMGPSVQALTADGSSNLTFREGGGANQPTPDVTAFPAPVAELLVKSNLTIKWFGVPHEYLSDNPYYLYPAKIVELLGSVNDADFIGLPKGTVLFLGAEFDPVLYPVVPSDPDEPLTGWDVTFHFEHYDPPKGVPLSEYRGHRVYPWRKDGKHYFASRETGTDEMLPLVDLYGIFQHVADPS